MTQDQWSQPANPGYVVRGEVVPNDESGAPQADQVPTMTRFQKVAGRTDPPASQDADETPAEEEGAVSSPDAAHDDYWDDDEDEAAEDTAAGPAGDAVVSASALATDPGAGPAAPAGQTEEMAGQAEEPAGQAGEMAGQAEEPAGQAGEMAHEEHTDGHDAAGSSMTPPNAFGTGARSPAADIPTIPIAVVREPAGDGGRPAEMAAADTASADTAAADTAAAGTALPEMAAAGTAVSDTTAPDTAAADTAAADTAAADASAADTPAAETGLRPGESSTTLERGESGYASLIADTADLREQWHRIQYKFVDDPRVSVTEAADVIGQVATKLEAAIAERQRGLRGRWDTSGTVDTETLRETLRMYRAFLDQLIGPEPS